MDPSRLPPPARRARPIVVVGAVAAVLVGVALIGGGFGGVRPSSAPSGSTGSPTGVVASGSIEPTTSAGDSTSPSVPSTSPKGSLGYLVLPTDLAARAAQAKQGVPLLRTAKDEVLADADIALAVGPHATQVLDIPGTEGPFVDDTAAAYGLGLAYAVSGDERYAAGARAEIMAWVQTTKQLQHACPIDGSCQTSLIVGRVVPGFVYAADLIRASAAWSAADEAAFVAWLHDLILPGLSERQNNWGDAGDFARAAITDYIGDRAGFAAALAEWRTRLDLIPADGHIPEETRRGTSGMSYTQEAIGYKVATARLAELRGVDLWSYVGKQGASLKSALDLLRMYWFAPATWPYDGNVRVPSPSPMWEIVYQHYQDPAWVKVFASDRPFGGAGHSAIRWTTLTNGIPLP
jgi:hypothetical protein